MDVTQRTNSFIREVLREARRHNWSYKRTKSSAQEELRWTCPNGKESVILSGWHGSDGWSIERSVHMLVHWDKKRFKPVSVHTVNDVEADYLPGGEMKPASAYQYHDRLEETKAKIFRIISK